MRRVLIGVLLALAVASRGVTNAAEGGLLSDPLNIVNSGTTVFKGGVYTITNQDAKAVSMVRQSVEVGQSEIQPLTFGCDARAVSVPEGLGCNYGCVVNLIYTDGSRLDGVNFGCDPKSSSWRTYRRTYTPLKPVKRIEFYMQLSKCRGKASFRNPFLTVGDALFKRFLDKIELKDRHLSTPLVHAGRATAAIVGDVKLAEKINATIKRLTGVVLPVLPHTAYGNADRLDRNLIVIGNRDRNRSISNLYNRHFTLLDARYPGKGGSEVRSLHNPFGDGHNVILVGGSDEEGDVASVDKLIGHLESAGVDSRRGLTLGFLSDATLSPSYRVPRDVKDIKIWEASIGYGEVGYYGWNSLARNLAMLYITNDPYYKNEFMRLAFPKDKATQDELFKRDDEAYDDRAEPIVKVYHYRGAFMLLYWDLVDENPLFSDAERLQVVRKIHELLHYRLQRYDLLRFKEKVLVRPHRHASWEVLMAYTAARYLNKDYPSSETAVGLLVGTNAFEPLYTSIVTSHIPLYWLGTATELQLYYAILQGHRFVDHPALREYIRGLSLLTDLTPGSDDRINVFTSGWTHLVGAYLAQDQAFIDILRNREIKGVASPKALQFDGFKLGQSFWPVAAYPHDSIKENLCRWNFFRTAKPENPKERELQYLSYRTAPDRSGDFILLDTRFDYGIREPQHNFSLVNATLAGAPVLRGFENAVTPFGNNLADLTQPFHSDIVSSGNVGSYCWATGLVKKFNGFNWQRTWLIKRGEFLIAADTLTAVQDLATARLENSFASQYEVSKMTGASNGEYHLRLNLPGGSREYTLSTSADATGVLTSVGWNDYHCGPEILTWRMDKESLKRGDVSRFVSLVRRGAPLAHCSTAPVGDAVALATPEPALWTWTADGFEFRSGDEVLTVAGNSGSLKKGDPAFGEKVETALRARTPKTKEVSLPESPLPVLWKQAVPPYAGAGCAVGSDKIAVASGKTLRLLDVASGKILWQRETSGLVGKLAWWPEPGLLVAGCRDEKLLAFDVNGELRWTFISEMAPEMMRLGPYHHKSAVPGIRSILPHGNVLYVGSAGTIEIVDSHGTLQKRQYVEFGPVDEIVPVPDSENVLLRRAWFPSLHSMTKDFRISAVPWNRGMQDDFWSFGFGQLGHKYVRYFRNRERQLRAVNVIGSVQNRLIVRNVDGKALREVNFGAGMLASARYEISALLDATIRCAAVVDLGPDGGTEIIVGTKIGNLYVFDQNLKLLSVSVTPSSPSIMVEGRGELYIGFDDGAVACLDGHGRQPRQVGKLSGTVTTLNLVGDCLLAGSGEGDLQAFRTVTGK